MTKRTHMPPHFTALPMLPAEAIYIGVDIGKFKHVAGFVSKTLLERHKHFENCPAFTFEQSREGFQALVERIRAYGPLEHCFLLYVIYNQGIKQGLLPLLDPCVREEEVCHLLFGGLPRGRDTLGTVSAGGTKRAGSRLAPEASSPSTCPNDD